MQVPSAARWARGAAAAEGLETGCEALRVLDARRAAGALQAARPGLALRGLGAGRGGACSVVVLVERALAIGEEAFARRDRRAARGELLLGAKKRAFRLLELCQAGVDVDRLLGGRGWWRQRLSCR